MKELITLLSLMFTAVSAHAADCAQLVKNSNWPEDKYKLLLSCEKVETSVGHTEFDGLCFAIMKTQSSQYRSTHFHTARYQPDVQGALHTIVSRDEDGTVSQDGKILERGSLLHVSEQKYSFEFGQRWIEKVSVDLKDTSILSFSVYNKKFLRTKLSESSLYSCKKLIP